ncbi:MAG TPA: DUF308 domain-containing protein [Tepidisphaeraceae bacterium]|jgi:hypothetical protein
MKFHIVGANRETGDDVKMVVEVADRSAAEQWARDNGIIWSEIIPHVPTVGLSGGKAPPRRDPIMAQPPSREIQASHQAAYSGAAVYLPQGGVALVNQTIVKPQKGTSGFGIAALILGIIAAIFCWIPFLGLLSVPVAALGLLIGIIGFLVSMLGRRSGVGMPVAGSMISLIAIVLAVVSTAGTANKIATKFQTDLKVANATNQQEVVASPDMPGPTVVAASTQPAIPPAESIQTPVSSPSKAPPQQEWITADKAVRQGDVQVKMLSAQVGKVQIKNMFDPDTPSFSQDELLLIKLEIRNLGDTKKIEYRTWAGGEFSLGDRDFATVSDNFENTYKRIGFGASSGPIGQIDGSESVYPSKDITDVIVFEPPIAKAKYLNLELPATNFGGTGMLRIRIPVSLIEQNKIATQEEKTNP